MGQNEKNMDDVYRRKEINIMHLSDLHFGIGRGDLAEREELLDAFFDDFKKIDSKWMPDIIVITGDIGWNGKKEDYISEGDTGYKSFNNFISKLLEKTELGLEDFICCPGNHDKFVSDDAPGFHNLSNDTDVHLVGNASWFQNYSHFLGDKGMQPLNGGKEVARYLYGYRSIKGVMFCVFNSAWLCDYRVRAGDRNKLRMGTQLAQEMYYSVHHEPEDERRLIISLFHHPLTWLAPCELEGRQRTLISLILENSDLVLHGHNHNERHMEVDGCVIRETGPLYSDDIPEHYVPRCNIYKLYLDEKEIQVGCYRQVSPEELKNGEVHWEWKIEAGFNQPEPLNIGNSYRKLKKEKDEFKNGLERINEALNNDIINLDYRELWFMFSELVHDVMGIELVRSKEKQVMEGKVLTHRKR